MTAGGVRRIDMNKPASVAIAEFKARLDRVINESGLPPVVLEPIMTAYTAALARAAAEQTAREAQEWADAQKEEDGGD